MEQQGLALQGGEWCNCTMQTSVERHANILIFCPVMIPALIQ
jgi:hypothetical protein